MKRAWSYFMIVFYTILIIAVEGTGHLIASVRRRLR